MELDFDPRLLRQRLSDPVNDGLWMRAQLLPRFAAGNQPRPTTPPTGVQPRPGAVLVLLYPHRGAITLPLTVRNADLPTHSGEVSLPGGRYEAADGDLSRTALREAWEELAIPMAAVELWTQLTPLWIPVSNFQITPFVGWSAQRPTFGPALEEVAEVIEAPLRLLLDPATLQQEERVIRGQRMHIPFFALGGHKVWGATALVLAEVVGKLISR